MRHCVCVCVCVCEREHEREKRVIGEKKVILVEIVIKREISQEIDK